MGYSHADAARSNRRWISTEAYPGDPGCWVAELDETGVAIRRDHHAGSAAHAVQGCATADVSAIPHRDVSGRIQRPYVPPADNWLELMNFRDLGLGVILERMTCADRTASDESGQPLQPSPGGWPKECASKKSTPCRISDQSTTLNMTSKRAGLARCPPNSYGETFVKG